MQGWGPWTLNLINTGVLDQRSLEFTKLFVTKKTTQICSFIGHVISANHLAISMHHTKVVGPGPHHCSLLDLILC